MATSGTIKSSVYKSHLWLTFNWSQSSQSIANNTSTVSWNLKLHWDARINFSASKSGSVTVNGTKYSFTYTGGASGSSGSVTLKSGTTTISHNADGTKSFSVSASFNINITYSGSAVNTMSLSGSGSLNTIARKSSVSVTSGSGTKPGSGNIVLSIARASSSFTHTITWSCAGLSGTVGTGLTTSATWAVPASIIEKSPNASQTVTFTCTTYSGGTAIGNTTCTATVGYYGPSTVSAYSNTIGTAKNVAVTRSSSLFTHTVTWAYGNQSGTLLTKGTSTSIAWTPAMSLCSQTPNGTSGTGVLRITTYYGNTQIGSTQSATITLSVPSSVVPSFSAITCVENVSEVSTKIGAYVQNKSRLTLAITGASGSYGSTIKTYKITGCGQTINAISGTTGVITVSGTQTITASITDSRGRTATKTLVINILPYTAPKILGSGVERATDTTANVSAQLEASSLVVNATEKNKLLYKVEYKSIDAAGYTTLTGEYATLKSNMARTVTGLNESKSYDFRIYVGDIFGYNNSPTVANISTAFKSFDFDTKNGRLGIQKVLEHEDSILEVPEGKRMYSGNNAIDFDNILIFVEE